MYAEVIPALPIESSFSYYNSVDAKIGSYVIVPFGTRLCLGIVINLSPACNISKVKKITKQVNIPISSPSFIRFIQWVAAYNIIPIGSILKFALNGMYEEEVYYTLSHITTSNLSAAYKKVCSALEKCEVLSGDYICHCSGVRKLTLKKMLEQGIIKLSARPALQNPIPEINIVLSDKQSQAYQEISQYTKYKTILLKGVTGSGKTEVYLSAIANILQNNTNAQALILLPEIILTSQLLVRFKKYFSIINITLWHSNLSKGQRQRNWWQIVNGKAQIIIGARSALFLPYHNLKMIIVDEEHDCSLKHSNGRISYHARDMAIVRAKEENIPIILSSATPSLESYYNAISGKFLYISLPGRYSNLPLPEIQVVDMKKNTKWISADLYGEIVETIKRHKQVLLFLNRRGYTPLTLCDECGVRLKCVNCSSWLVQHNFHQAFICHHCGYKIPLFNQCIECGAEDSFVACGPGIEKIEEEVRLRLPDARVLVISSDVITSVKKNEEWINDILAKNVDIIIGTQLMAKGHHFPDLHLVGIIDADSSLYGGDLRSAERTYQILQQVSGRAGRSYERGKVILQSYNSDSLTHLFKDDDFYQNELQSRKIHHMPPFRRITSVIISNANHDKVMSLSSRIAQELSHNQLKILGPTPANIAMVKKKYIYKIILISDRNFNIQKHIRGCRIIQQYKSLVTINIDSNDSFL